MFACFRGITSHPIVHFLFVGWFRHRLCSFACRIVMLAMLAGFARRNSDLVSRFAYALPCVVDLCRLARSGCCFCCASDDFFEPCLLLSRSACAASWCTGVLSASDCGCVFSRKIQFWFQKYLFLRVEMRSHFWLQFLKHLQ